MVHTISILGSTGSIGRQTVEVAEHLGLETAAICAGSDIRLLEEQARRLKPKLVGVSDEKKARELRVALSDTPVQVLGGAEAATACAAYPKSDCVVTAMSGAAGLLPTLAAVSEKKRIALANKETLVCAGTLVMRQASEYGAEIVPVDSEHSAIFQCLEGRREALRRILLTASGGPFRGLSLEEVYAKTPQEALAHPNWNMGAKISVDSATMMNKGLEFIEAMHLFGADADQISVLIHPESVVHSAVELRDGAVIAQLGTADMRLPIQYALTYPERRESLADSLSLETLSGLHFSPPDLGNTPCLALAMDCARRGGTAAAVLSAANEEAVSLFLQGKICFGQIYETVAETLERVPFVENPGLEEILDCDRLARLSVRETAGRYPDA